MDLSTIISVAEGAVRLAIDVPVLAVGIVVGALGYGFLLKRWPALTARLVADAKSEVQTLIGNELTKNAVASAALSNVAQTTASAAPQDKAGTASK